MADLTAVLADLQRRREAYRGIPSASVPQIIEEALGRIMLTEWGQKILADMDRAAETGFPALMSVFFPGLAGSVAGGAEAKVFELGLHALAAFVEDKYRAGLAEGEAAR